MTSARALVLLDQVQLRKLSSVGRVPTELACWGRRTECFHRPRPHALDRGLDLCASEAHPPQRTAVQKHSPPRPEPEPTDLTRLSDDRSCVVSQVGEEGCGG